MINTKIVTVMLACAVFFLVLDLIRREKLTFKYAAFWIFVSGGAAFFAIFDRVLFRMASFLGFQLPSTFIFFTLLSVFVFLGLLMTIFLCQQNSRNEMTAQKIGLLELEIEQMKSRKVLDNEAGKDDS